MKLLTITLLTTCTLLCGCCGSDCGTADASLDYAAINAQAAEQYLRPIRPGYEGRNPFWNGFAKKFIYAPAFDFDEVAGAANYRFTVVPLGEETQASWSFTADSPKAALTPVWGEIPVGRVRLTVEGLDASGKALGKAGEREFLRDYPFTGPYTPAVRDYRQAALMGLLYIHRMPEIQYWAEHTEPDMNYRHNTYPCKIIGATIRAEALLARLLPAHKEQATRIARNAAQFLIDQSRPAGDPLAFFPPTYYKDLIASKRTENQNKTMTMEAASAGHAFLDLYDLTGDKAYYDRALGIADTYVRLQREDGSLPIKVDFVTGEPVNDADASYGKQLVYVPEYAAAATATLGWRRWTLVYKWNYYSERYTTTSNDTSLRTGRLEPYYMSDLSLERSFALRWADLSLKGVVRNLFNVEYVTVLSRPMPRLNYEIFLDIRPKFHTRKR